MNICFRDLTQLKQVFFYLHILFTDYTAYENNSLIRLPSDIFGVLKDRRDIIVYPHWFWHPHGWQGILN